jgi:D-3-phosphoglycerate dehydrogenase / 2-oxoglutarate reductase
MLGMISEFTSYSHQLGLELHCPNVVQTLTEDELIALVQTVDGWIIGDDPATRRVLLAGRNGKLRAAVKWGIGTDNVDLIAAEEINLPIKNTPGLFGKEVADLAMSYITALARHTFEIDRGVRAGSWPKPRGISLSGSTVGIVGMGDIGRNLAKRALAADMRVIGYDPGASVASLQPGVRLATWPSAISECDFLAICCALTTTNRHMINADVLREVQHGLRLVNVSRGALIDEMALSDALRSGQLRSAALDVFEAEPLCPSSPLRDFPNCIFGAHNASNTDQAVVRASRQALTLLHEMLCSHESRS